MSESIEKALNIISDLLVKLDDKDEMIMRLNAAIEGKNSQIKQMSSSSERNIAKLEEYYKKEIKKLEKQLADLSPVKFPEADDGLVM